MKSKWSTAYRLTATALITSMISINMAGAIYAGPPAVSVDETLYVNLDYYGKETDSSVVKGVTLNGIRSFSDYGTYKDITNMSNYAKPVVDGDTVNWQLPEDAKDRFYYEGQLDNGEVVLPWDFDISYKLNGVPKEAQDLLHADGLVEIDVHCIPNKNANVYYQNNMLLQVASMVDMEDVNSVEAPGAQIQSLGTYKAVLFAAVPGQEKTFHIEISSHDFESSGVIMMMVPGTLDQISDIADVKEAKDTFKDSADELLDGMNEMLDTLHNISNGMDVTKKGLSQLQGARENFDASKDEIISNADASIDGLEAANQKISQLAPDIMANKQGLDVVNNKVNTLVETLQDSGEDFYNLSSSLRDLKDSLGDLQNGLEESDADQITGEIKDIEQQLDAIQDVLKKLGSTASPSQALSEDDLKMQAESMQQLMSDMNDVLDDLEFTLGADAVAKLRAQLQSVAASGTSNPNATALIQTAAVLSKILNSMNSILSSVRYTISGIDVQGGVKDSKAVVSKLAAITYDIDTTIGDVVSLNKTKNDNKAAFDLMLDDTAASVEQISSATNQVISLFRSVQNTIKNNRGAVEGGTKDTLNGLIDILEKAAETSSTTNKLKGANESIRNSLDEKLDKIADDSNLLEMNLDDKMVSFTSDKNQTPSSIQIIIRSQEISEDDINTNAVDIEPAPVDVGVWQRVKNVFAKMWNAVTGIFS
jgi:predicted nuclease with TOPRIM domain